MLWWWVGLALAQTEAAPERGGVWTDFNADTLSQGQVGLGALRQEYGVLDNLEVGTKALGWVLGFPNYAVKVTAVDTDRLDFSLAASGYAYDLEKHLGISGGLALATPLAWTLSWQASDRWSVHLGSTKTRVEASGLLTLDQLGDSLAQVLEVDIGPEISALLEDSGALYGGASIELVRALLALEYRWSLRSSVVLISRTYASLEGRVDAGYGTEDETVALGAAAHFNLPVSSWFDSLTTLSYQHSWERLHLRLGLVLPAEGDSGLSLPPGGIFQACRLYWVI